MTLSAPIDVVDARADLPRPADEPPVGRRSSPLLTAGLYVASLLAALVLSGVLVSATGGSATAVFGALLDGSIRSPGAWGLTLTTAAPLLVVAVGTVVATRAGLVNIGQEGQLLVGAVFAAYLATRIGGPGWSTIVLAALFAGVGGGLWAGIAAALRAWRGIPEVLSTLLLTFIAFPLTTLGLKHEWLIADRETRVNHINSGQVLPDDASLPDLRIFGNAIDVGLLVGVAVALGVAFVLARTVLGFRLRVLGLNPRAAQRFGVQARRMGAAALVVSGFLAGVGGALLLHGGAAGDRITIGYSSNFGWDGLLVALLARGRAALAIPMALVFAALRTGSGFLAATGVDRRITDVVQALLVLALLVPPALAFLSERRRAALARSAAT